MYYARQYEVQHGSARHPVLSVPLGDSSMKLAACQGRDPCLLNFYFIYWQASSASDHWLPHQQGSTMLDWWYRLRSLCRCLGYMNIDLVQIATLPLAFFALKFILPSRLYFCLYCPLNARFKSNRQSSLLADFHSRPVICIRACFLRHVSTFV